MSVQHQFVEQQDIEAIDAPLVQVANSPFAKLNRSTTGFGRAEIVNAFNTAFQMIGGVSRLAIWADRNPGEFYKLYGKLLPSSSQVDLTGEQTITIQHVLPRPVEYATTVDMDGDDGESAP